MQQRDPGSEPAIGQDAADNGPEPGESGFDDAATSGPSRSGGDLDDLDPSSAGDGRSNVEGGLAGTRPQPE